jgi:hypothetical protein
LNNIAFKNYVPRRRKTIWKTLNEKQSLLKHASEDICAEHSFVNIFVLKNNKNVKIKDIVFINMQKHS